MDFSAEYKQGIWPAIRWCICTISFMWVAVAVSHALEHDTYEITIIWPAGAVAIWLFIRYGRWGFIPVVIGQEAYHIFSMPYENIYTFFSLCNGTAAWLGAAAYYYLGGRSDNISQLKPILSLVFGATTIQSFFSAITGCIALAIARSLNLLDLEIIFIRWFFSDLTGNVLFCPLLLAVSNVSSWVGLSFRERLVPIIIAGSVLIIMWFLVNSPALESLGQYPAMLLSLPACLWLSMRKSTAMVTISLVVILTGSLFVTTLVAREIDDGNFIALQIYAAVIMGSCMVLHSMRLSRDQAITELDMQKQQLEFAVARRTEQLQKQVEETEALAAKLEQQALSDYLTGLPNRRAFTLQVNQELQRNERSGQTLALLLVDIDHFKRVNDDYGHITGDTALKTLGIAFDELVRQGTDFVARLGGEEFGFLLPDTDRAGALKTAERIRKTVENVPIAHPDGVFYVTVSIGVAISVRRRTIEQMLNEADKAMYRAKYNGRNRVEYGYDLEVTTGSGGL